MKYCKSCILPDTRPGVILDNEGICSACKSSKQKQEAIDWNKREKLFNEVVKQAKKRSKGYDCVIPVSGGKDSTWQVIKCLEYGLNPLAITWKTPARTSLGQKNLDNLISLGVDHIDYQINPKVEKKFIYKSLVKYGSTAIPMHMALFNIPLKIAVKFDIPLVIWGENSAFEYGGKDDKLKGYKLDRKWLKKYGVTHGTTAKDWVGKDLTKKELTPYFGPSDAEMEQKGIVAVFLGHYFNWTPQISYNVAKQNGFLEDANGPRVGFYNYADIDDDFISIHHYLKWYKFGITRTFDNLSLEIRNGNITRKQALDILKKTGDETPINDIRKLCSFLGITEKHFFDVIEKFRNKKIWELKKNKWEIENFIIPDWKF